MPAERRVATNHSFTGRMCAASRWEETNRPDSLFQDRLARKLAGQEGMASPMGAWILVPRTRFGDDFLQWHYDEGGCRQLVLLGAGMDARAWRLTHMPELRVFEVDQQTTFDVKEPLVRGEALTVHSREVVGTEFNGDRKRWAEDLLAKGFDTSVPTVWLLEGLLMYLSMDDSRALMELVGDLSASGSAVFHDAITHTHLGSRISVAGAPFIGGSDDYGLLWAKHAGFTSTYVRGLDSIWVDRRHRRLGYDERVPELTSERCRYRNYVLFVTAAKP